VTVGNGREGSIPVTFKVVSQATGQTIAAASGDGHLKKVQPNGGVRTNLLQRWPDLRRHRDTRRVADPKLPISRSSFCARESLAFSRSYCWRRGQHVRMRNA